MRTLLQPFYTLYVLTTFILSLFLAFPFFLILGAWNKSTGRRLITLIVQYWCKGWLFIIGMPLKVSGSFPKEQRFVIVANHISYLDTVNIYASIPDYFRALGKKEMVNIPVFGFLYKQLAILVDRSSQRSRAKSMRLMWRHLRKEGHIAVFPEGTFNETTELMKDFYDGAFRLAINTKVPVLPLLFPDTVNRWHYSHWWKIWPGKNRAVFLPPFDVSNLTLEDLPALKEKVKMLMSEEMARLKGL